MNKFVKFENKYGLTAIITAILIMVFLCSCEVKNTAKESDDKLIEVKLVQHIPKIVRNPDSFWWREVAQEESFIYEDTLTKERMSGDRQLGNIGDVFKVRRSKLNKCIFTDR